MVLAQLDLHTQSIRWDPCLTVYTKTDSKWVNNLYVRVKTRKPLEEDLGINFHDLRLKSAFLDKKQKSHMTKEKNQLDFIKIKNICARNNTIEKVKRMRANYISDKEFISRMFFLK